MAARTGRLRPATQYRFQRMFPTMAVRRPAQRRFSRCMSWRRGSRWVRPHHSVPRNPAPINRRAYVRSRLVDHGCVAGHRGGHCEGGARLRRQARCHRKALGWSGALGRQRKSPARHHDEQEDGVVKRVEHPAEASGEPRKPLVLGGLSPPRNGAIGRTSGYSHGIL